MPPPSPQPPSRPHTPPPPQKLLGADYFGADGEWFALKGECFDYAPGGEFSYKLCPFDRAGL